jgi:hypothetical protein
VCGVRGETGLVQNDTDIVVREARENHLPNAVLAKSVARSVPCPIGN